MSSSTLVIKVYVISLLSDFVVFFISQSTQMVKRNDDKIHPCLTPVFILKLFESWGQHFRRIALAFKSL